MEITSGGFLQQFLSAEELAKFPNEILQKLESYILENYLKPFEETKAIAETYKTSIGEYFSTSSISRKNCFA
jgi:hypothetical protein